MQIPADSGPREYATGVALLDASGVPVAYEVGRGDIMDFVAARFVLEGPYLVAINQVRRGFTGVLYFGDVLNLDPHTITSVGTINGMTKSDPAPSPLPPQR